VELSLRTSVVEGVTVIGVGGEVDVSSSPTLRDRLTEVLDSGHGTAVVDLTEVTFLDSTGLGTLVGAFKRAEELSGSLPIVCPHERILKLFRITGLDTVFMIHDAVPAAVAAAQSAGGSPDRSADA
jgi:anti-sigma B factor antagonist